VSDVDVLLDMGKTVEAIDEPSARHLTSPLSLRDYVRIADETAREMHGARLLDWGCGYGQMSYLLARRGVAVTSYDVGTAVADRRVPVTHGLRAVRGSHPYRLPFRSAAFDAVLACGVLEHVPETGLSLDEIRRVLQPGGQLFVYNLPQKYSYKELLIGRLRLGYSHASRYTGASIRRLLEAHGFRVRRVRRAGVLPYMATGLPRRARRAYYGAASTLFPVDRALSRVPVVNLVAQSLEIVAERPACDDPAVASEVLRRGARSPVPPNRSGARRRPA
jgi:ubiquinone/menaquinone biosynthesis C-methylase UbiE